MFFRMKSAALEATTISDRVVTAIAAIILVALIGWHLVTGS
jgi:hypothetical protein